MTPGMWHLGPTHSAVAGRAQSNPSPFPPSPVPCAPQLDTFRFMQSLEWAEDPATGGPAAGGAAGGSGGGSGVERQGSRISGAATAAGGGGVAGALANPAKTLL